MLNPSVAGKVLMIVRRDKRMMQEISSLLNKNELLLAVEHDLGTAIHRAQTARFDVIVLDANIKGMPIEQTIQILRDIDPGARIIVKTQDNSKELEAKVRRERIFYYHLDSFGPEDLRLAIKSALIKRFNFMPGQAPAAKTQPTRILMVDENDEFIEVHRANLESHHFEVELSFDADEALLKLKKLRPELVMIDMDIPVGSDGLHFVEKMMIDDEGRKIPALLFVSKTRMSLLEPLIEKVKSTLPTWSFLEKPIKIEDVIPRVSQLLNSIHAV